MFLTNECLLDIIKAKELIKEIEPELADKLQFIIDRVRDRKKQNSRNANIYNKKKRGTYKDE
jgi:hypothetical protein